MSESGENRPRRRSVLRRIGRGMGIGIVAMIVAGMTVWGMLFLYYSPLPGAWFRGGLAGAFGMGTLAAFIVFKKRRRTLVIFVGVFAALVIWFFCIPASNQRDWESEVAVLPKATIAGNLVTIQKIRNLDYRTEKDFTPRYYDKTFDLEKLESVDLVCVYWGSEAIAHVMTSFGFGENDFVTFSIETRKERGESYSTLAGFFRHYELTYVVADERDVIGVRTNHRNPREDVYIYRVRLPRENQRKLFVAYIGAVNELAERPAWYNTLNDNCTTGVLRNAQSYSNRGKYNWKILLSGYSAEYAYEIGMLDTSMPFEELRERCHVNAKAQAADGAGDFSRRIREGVPAPAPMTLEEFMPTPAR